MPTAALIAGANFGGAAKRQEFINEARARMRGN
jgi:hypothetical protein